MTTDLYGTLLQASSIPSRSLPSHAPPVGGVRISTCSFQLTETFQTSAEELYRTFLEQEVPQLRTPLLPPPLDLLVSSISTFPSSLFPPSLTPRPPPFFFPPYPHASPSQPLLPIAPPVTPPPPLTPLTLPPIPSFLPLPSHCTGFFLLQCHCPKAVVPSLSSLCRLSLALLQWWTGVVVGVSICWTAASVASLRTW